MPGLKLYTSNRMEILVDHLSKILKRPLPRVLTSEIIIVQSKGMERWLSLEIAKRLGICTNVKFPFPIHFVYDIFRRLLPFVPENSPFEATNLLWTIMYILPFLLDNPGFQFIKNYLEKDETELKLFQLSEQIAELFSQYLLFRPDMIIKWDQGSEDHWQAVLWREIVKRNGRIHPMALYQNFFHALQDSQVEFSNIPERISIFGITALPPFYVQILSDISSFVEVSMFLMNPCREFWEDIVSRREISLLMPKNRRKDIPREDLYLESGNRLLASMGSLGRDFYRMISELPCEEIREFADPEEATLLCAIQSDILNLRERNHKIEVSFNAIDDSIRIHSCHSPLREMEVLQDYLLTIFEKCPDIQPDDVLVMIPDIESYAPLIQGVFSMPIDDPRSIPFTIADRGFLMRSDLIDTFFKLLDLAGSRFNATNVMEILEYEVVRTNFSISEEDMNIINHWIKKTGIRWGIDIDHKAKMDLPAFPWNTWRAGLDRMLLGYALPAKSADNIFNGILPFNDIEGENREILGNFLRYAEKLIELIALLEQKRHLAEWYDLLLEMLGTFFSDEEKWFGDIRLIRNVIADLLTIQASSSFDKKVALDVVKYWLKKILAEKNVGTGFLSGGMTFCTILPMRSIPFKVVCLIGMSDAAYPRQSRSLGFDLMTRNPCIGDRSRRIDDRYLFLEALLSSRQKLYISYVGQSLKDNSLLPPSVLVSEVLDYIEDGFGKSAKEMIFIRHRLQAFNPVYFLGEQNFPSYSEENFRAACCAASIRKKPTTFIPSGLSEPLEEQKKIDLESLCQFFTNPARYLLNRRLGIYLQEESVLLGDSEPFELDKLDEYLFRQDLTILALEGNYLRDLYPVMQASGRLPHGTPGKYLYYELCKSTDDFVGRVQAYLGKERRDALDVDINIDDFHLTGRLVNLYPHGLIFYRLSKMKAHDRLRSWISHLILNNLKIDVSSYQTILVCEDRTVRYLPLDNAEKHLNLLINLYFKGIIKPINFFPESSLVYGERTAQKKDAEALKAALRKWQGNEFSEKNNPYYKFCFGEIDPLDDEFRKLADAVFKPMLRYEERIK